MKELVSTYKGQSIEIVYDRRICIHAAECGRGSKKLFNVNNDPWCDPDAVSADKAATIVARCHGSAVPQHPDLSPGGRCLPALRGSPGLLRAQSVDQRERTDHEADAEHRDYKQQFDEAVPARTGLG